KWGGRDAPAGFGVDDVWSGRAGRGRHQLGWQLHLRQHTRTAGRHLRMATAATTAGPGRRLRMATAATTAGSGRFTWIRRPRPRPAWRAVVLVLVAALTGIVRWWR